MPGRCGLPGEARVSHTPTCPFSCSASSLESALGVWNRFPGNRNQPQAKTLKTLGSLLPWWVVAHPLFPAWGIGV